MRRALGLTIVALALVVVASAHAQQRWEARPPEVFTGTVIRIDPGAGVIVFEDGRMVQTTADSVILSGNQRVMLATLLPGTAVSVYGSQPVAFREGRYVVLSASTARPAPPSSTVVIAPPAAVVTAPQVVVTTPPAGTPAPGSQPPPRQAVFEATGTVLRTDWDRGVIVMTDGRTVHVDADSQVLVNNRPVPIGTIAPGTPVVVRSTKPFAGAQGHDSPMREVASGTVVRVEKGSAIVLGDGRIIPTSAGTVVMVENRPVTVATIGPGTRVIIYEDAPPPVVSEPSASPPLYPGAGLRERELERPSGQ